jgi:apolipoprotein N-acyltransferase
VTFTPLICFESVFPELCREGVRAGSELFVNITNDGWFGDTPGPYQHAQMCVARAVEFRRYLVRSANSGISMVVTPAGEVRESMGLDQPGVLTSDVLLLSGETFYARFGDAPLLGACALVLAGAGIAVRRRGETAGEAGPDA